MYCFKEYWSAPKKYEARWIQGGTPFSKPHYGIVAPLEQCRFVMTRLDLNKKPYPVDMWGNSIDPKVFGTADFRKNVQPLWIDGQNAFFDGYSIVLDSKPEPIYLSDQTYYIVAAIYENCVTWNGNDISFSNEFVADRIALNYPIMWLTPDRKGMCWAGLSRYPILGGKNASKVVSSYDLSIPITSGFFRENGNFDFSCNSLELLPEIADHIISKWFRPEGLQQ